jgi:hypothetical protein
MGKITSIKKTRLFVYENEIFIGDNYKDNLFKALGLDIIEEN